jgi:hypothetical protein
MLDTLYLAVNGVDGLSTSSVDVTALRHGVPLVIEWEMYPAYNRTGPVLYWRTSARHMMSVDLAVP